MDLGHVHLPCRQGDPIDLGRVIEQDEAACGRAREGSGQAFGILGGGEIQVRQRPAEGRVAKGSAYQPDRAGGQTGRVGEGLPERLGQAL